MAKDSGSGIKGTEGIGSWVDYIEALVVEYRLEEAWED